MHERITSLNIEELTILHMEKCLTSTKNHFYHQSKHLSKNGRLQGTVESYDHNFGRAHLMDGIVYKRITSKIRVKMISC